MRSAGGRTLLPNIFVNQKDNQTMKHVPMPFETEMVQAMLKGNKSTSRCPINVPRGWDLADTKLSKITSSHPKAGKWGALINRGIGSKFPEHDLITAPCSEGDLIYVRETFATLHNGTYEEISPYETGCQEIRYKASERAELANSTDWEVRGYKWRPSTQMPKHCSRLTLKVTKVSIQRVTDITDNEAVLEGMPTVQEAQEAAVKAGLTWYQKPRKWFQSYWCKRYGQDAWDSSKFVWVIEYEVVQKNILKL